MFGNIIGGIVYAAIVIACFFGTGSITNLTYRLVARIGLGLFAALSIYYLVSGK